MPHLRESVDRQRVDEIRRLPDSDRPHAVRSFILDKARADESSLTPFERCVDLLEDLHFQVIRGGLTGFLYNRGAPDQLRKYIAALQFADQADLASSLEAVAAHVDAATQVDPALPDGERSWGEWLDASFTAEEIAEFEEKIEDPADELDEVLDDLVRQHEAEFFSENGAG